MVNSNGSSRSYDQRPSIGSSNKNKTPTNIATRIIATGWTLKKYNQQDFNKTQYQLLKIVLLIKHELLLESLFKCSSISNNLEAVEVADQEINFRIV